MIGRLLEEWKHLFLFGALSQRDHIPSCGLDSDVLFLALDSIAFHLASDPQKVCQRDSLILPLPLLSLNSALFFCTLSICNQCFLG